MIKETFVFIGSVIVTGIDSITGQFKTWLMGDTIAGFATVATSGDYNDLSNCPGSSTPIVYIGTTQVTTPILYTSSGTVVSGTIVFQLTTTGLSGGASIFPTAVIKPSVNISFNDPLAAYQTGYVFSNSDKTLTITANKLGTASLLTGLLGQNQANGATVFLTVWGY